MATTYDFAEAVAYREMLVQLRTSDDFFEYRWQHQGTGLREVARKFLADRPQCTWTVGKLARDFLARL